MDVTIYGYSGHKWLWYCQHSNSRPHKQPNNQAFLFRHSKIPINPILNKQNRLPSLKTRCPFSTSLTNEANLIESNKGANSLINTCVPFQRNGFITPQVTITTPRRIISEDSEIPCKTNTSTRWFQKSLKRKNQEMQVSVSALHSSCLPVYNLSKPYADPMSHYSHSKAIIKSSLINFTVAPFV